jgi:hypothetical protein
VNTCPWCDNRPDESCVQDVGGPGCEWWAVVCPECEAQGPRGTTKEAAVAVWDERADK